MLVPAILLTVAACADRQLTAPTAPTEPNAGIELAPASAALVAPTAWSASGPGTVTLHNDGSTANPSMSYALHGSGGFSSKTWSFSTVAASAGVVSQDWVYGGYHAFFQVRVFLRPFIIHNAIKSFLPGFSHGPVNCCTPPSGGFHYTGTTVFNVAAGDTYGFEFGGQHFDSDSRLLGTFTAVFPADATPPVITPTVTGTLGDNGWYTSNVDVSWSVTDNESAITATSGCTSTTLSTDSNGVTYTCTASSAGGSSNASVTVKRDATAPVVVGSQSGTLGNNDWYTSNIAVSFAVSDATSGIASSTGCGGATVSTDTNGSTFACSATDNAGNSASDSESVKRDATDPDIAFSGNAGSYSVDQTVAITCAASDAMSGLASSSCPGASGAAYALGLGSHTLNASAEDNAGNTTNASTSFTVTVTSGSLCALVERWVNQHGIANSMCKQLQNGAYGAFRNHVKAQSGKSVSAENAAILIALSQSL